MLKLSIFTDLYLLKGYYQGSSDIMSDTFRSVLRIFWIFSISLAACDSIKFTSKATETATVTSFPTPSDTITLAPSLTPTATLTATPTFTPTPTITPTPVLYVFAGTALPLEQLPISLQNAAYVSAIAEIVTDNVTDMEWSPDGYFLVASNAQAINFYEVQTRRLLRTLYPRAEEIVSIAFDPTGKWLVSGSSRGSEESGYASNLEYWLGPDWKPLGILYGSVQAMSDLAFSSDGLDLSVAYSSPVYSENSVDLWNTQPWEIVYSLFTGTVLNVAFSPDGRYLATSPDRYAIRVWDMKEREWLYKFHTSFTGAVNALAFSPDGLTLASGHYDGKIHFWDMISGEMVLEIDSNEVVQSLAFSPDGSLLASGGSFEGNFVNLWSAGSGAFLRSLNGHNAGVTHVQFSPFNQYLASASYDGQIILWGIRP